MSFSFKTICCTFGLALVVVSAESSSNAVVDLLESFSSRHDFHSYLIIQVIVKKALKEMYHFFHSS